MCRAAASGRGTGGRVPGSEAPAPAGDGAAERLPEQDQDADRGPARARAAETGAEGVSAQSPSRTEGMTHIHTLHTSQNTP